jgi:hypothetical protein
MKQLIWTVRVEGRREPSLSLTHEGPDSAIAVERAVSQAKARGETVIVGLATKRPKVEVTCE